jgi:spectinomycin phosphotransferase
VSLSYQAIGAGSHHWLATDAMANRLFVTVDDLELKPWLGADPESALPGLENAYDIARTLHGNGLEFVVAPIPTVDDRVVIRLDDRFTLAVFPVIEGVAADFEAMPKGDERRATLLMWARLHAATPLVRARAAVRGFVVPCRADLEAAIGETDRDWGGGPHSAAAREWVASNRDWLASALALFDSAARHVAAKRGELVITHGEPHGANLMRAGESRFLIDWDTVAMALPERDLWMLDDGRPDAFDAYVDATGRSVDHDAIALYGIAWHLTDIALFVELLRGSHVDDGDTRKVLADLPVAKARLAPYMPK